MKLVKETVTAFEGAEFEHALLLSRHSIHSQEKYKKTSSASVEMVLMGAHGWPSVKSANETTLVFHPL